MTFMNRYMDRSVIGRRQQQTQGQPAAAQAPQASSLAEMLGGNLYARQVADNSMSPLAMLQAFRQTGQIPMNPGSGVMFGQMGQAEQRPSAIGNLPMVAGKPQRTTGGK